MSIKETKIKGFDNPLLYDKLNYPQCTCGECPRFYFNSLHIGSRGVRNLHSATHKWQRRRVQLLIALYQHFYKVAQVNLDTTSPCTPSQYV